MITSLLDVHSMLGPNQNGEVYTDHMSQELIAIISAAIVIAGIIVPGQWAMRRDMTELRKDIEALGERVGKVELGLVDRVGRLEAALVERIARLEVATEGFIKPQSTPQ